MKPDSSMTDGVLVLLITVIIIAAIIALVGATTYDDAGIYSSTLDSDTNAGPNLYATSDTTNSSPSRRKYWTPRSPIWTRTTSPLEGKRYGVDKRAVLRGKLQAGELFQ